MSSTFSILMIERFLLGDFFNKIAFELDLPLLEEDISNGIKLEKKLLHRRNILNQKRKHFRGYWGYYIFSFLLSKSFHFHFGSDSSLHFRMFCSFQDLYQPYSFSSFVIHEGLQTCQVPPGGKNASSYKPLGHSAVIHVGDGAKV